MAVATSGELKFLSVAKELRYNNPAATIPDSTVLLNFPNGISLTEMSTGVGAFSSYPINQANELPDEIAPHAISEFYGYDHDLAGQPAAGFYEILSRSGPTLYTGAENTSNTDVIVRDYVEDNYPNGKNSRWRSFYFTIPENWKGINNLRITPYVQFYQSNQDFRNDVAISGQWVFTDLVNGDIMGIPYSGNQSLSTGAVGQNATSGYAPYTVPNTSWTWTDIPNNFNEPSSLRWGLQSLETPSNGTGPEEDPVYKYRLNGNIWQTEGDEQSSRQYYFYCETSGTYSSGYSHFRFKEPAYIPYGARHLTFCYSAWSQDGVNDFTNDVLKVWLYLEYINVNSVACGGGVEYSGGQSFPSTHTINLGSGTGEVRLDFNAINVPDKFIVEYNGVEVINTGYRGASHYQDELNTALAERSLPSETIQGEGLGYATFNKTTTSPTTAVVKVYAPIPETGWDFVLRCPE